MTGVNWPSFFPPQCPPSEAKDASAEVFRFVSSDPPLVGDFEAWAQKRPKKWMGNCKAAGLSVFTAKTDLLRLARRVPGISTQGRLVASANLSSVAGKLMHTPRDGDSHHTWWAPAGFNHTEAFKVVI
jgi:hypothetical protein